MRYAKYSITTNSSEESKWKRIFLNGTETWYDVNSDGEVVNRNTNSYVKSYSLTMKREIIRLKLNSKYVNISKKRLIAALFIPVPDKYKDIDQIYLHVYHANGDRTDFSLDNLKWYYPRDDEIDSEDLPYYHSLSIKKVKEVIELILSEKYSLSEIMEIANVSRDQVTTIKNNPNSYLDLRPDAFPRLQQCHYPESKIKEACELLESGNYTRREVSEMLNISYDVVKKLSTGDLHTDIGIGYDLENVKKCQMSESLVRKICVLLQDIEKSLIDIAAETEVEYKYIHAIYSRRIHTGVSKHYEWPIRDNGKLKNDIVISICKDLQAGKLSFGKIAKKYSCSIPSVSKIYYRERHTDISKDYSWNITVHKSEPTPRSVVIEICRLLQDTDMRQIDIAAKVGCGKCVVNDIFRRKSYKEISKDYTF